MTSRADIILTSVCIVNTLEEFSRLQFANCLSKRYVFFGGKNLVSKAICSEDPNKPCIMISLKFDSERSALEKWKVRKLNSTYMTGFYFSRTPQFFDAQTMAVYKVRIGVGESFIVVNKSVYETDAYRAMMASFETTQATCASCHIKPEPPRACMGCLLVSYCDRPCQVADWKAHKKCCRAHSIKKSPEVRMSLFQYVHFFCLVESI
jgi:MYND finger